MVSTRHTPVVTSPKKTRKQDAIAKAAAKVCEIGAHAAKKPDLRQLASVCQEIKTFLNFAEVICLSV